MTEAGHLVDADPGLMVPRAVVDGLLEVEPVEWVRKRWHCLYCEASAPERPAHPDCVDHTDTCPWAMLRALAS